MRRLVVALALAVCATLVPSPAAAAMCFEFTLDHNPPHIGEVTNIDVRTLWASGLKRFSLRVWAPDRSTSVMELPRVSGEERWRGGVVFDRPGIWALQAEIAVPANEYPCFYKAFDVPPARGRGDLDALALAAVVTIVLGIAILGALVLRGHGFTAASPRPRFR